VRRKKTDKKESGRKSCESRGGGEKGVGAREKKVRATEKRGGGVPWGREVGKISSEGVIKNYGKKSLWKRKRKRKIFYSPFGRSILKERGSILWGLGERSDPRFDSEGGRQGGFLSREKKKGKNDRRETESSRKETVTGGPTSWEGPPEDKNFENEGGGPSRKKRKCSDQVP